MYPERMDFHPTWTTHLFAIVAKIAISINLATKKIDLFLNPKHSKEQLNIAFVDYPKYKYKILRS